MSAKVTTPIFNNEEEFNTFFDNIISEYYKESYPLASSGYDINKTKEATREKAKELGYIRKSLEDSVQDCLRILIDSAHRREKLLEELKELQIKKEGE